MTVKTDAVRAFDNVRAELESLQASGADTRLLEVTLQKLSEVIYSEKWAALRKPFPASVIGKLPRVTCRGCRDASRGPASGTCAQHQRKWCDGCKNTISSAHIHLDYIGHAAVTDRINSVDPEWTWTVQTCDENGSPLFDRNGGLWIWITILGVTRPAYGDAEGKSGADAVKAAISDALKNGAMRFGVGLDLWSKEDLLALQGEPKPAEEPTRPRGNQPATESSIDWLKVPAATATLAELKDKARECNEAGQFRGPILAAFTKRKKELEKAEAATEERGLRLVKDELGEDELGEGEVPA